MGKRGFTGLILALVLLIGCAGSDQGKGKEMTAAQPLFGGAQAVCDQGFYYLNAFGKDRWILHFWDLENHRDEILCRQQGCTHRKEDCGACFQGNVFVFCQNGEAAYVLEQSGEVTCWKIRPDSPDREKIWQLDADREMKLSRNALIRDQHMYLGLYTGSREGENPCEIWEVDLTRGEGRKICLLPRENSMIVAMYQNKLFVKCYTHNETSAEYEVLSVDVTRDGDPEPVFRQYLTIPTMFWNTSVYGWGNELIHCRQEGGHYGVYGYQVTGGRLRQITELPDHGIMFGAVLDLDLVYVFKENSHSVCQLDLLRGQMIYTGGEDYEYIGETEKGVLLKNVPESGETVASSVYEWHTREEAKALLLKFEN